ncbi:MAG: PfkB family carbohydrate kinase, partial [Pseudomonadota bacterium]
CIVYDGPIPDDLEGGIVGKGFPIEVYNVLGAGDSFMSGFLRGWLRGEDHATSATWANACGAFAVSRLLCSPEIPTWDELNIFLRDGSPHHALRRDENINHIHWATTRRRAIPALMAFAIDHRVQLTNIADELNVQHEAIGAFKRLAVAAAAQVADGRNGFGMLIDERFGRDALFDAAKHDFSWIGRPVEEPGSRPLAFEYSQDIGSQLLEWPVDHCVKVLCFYHPDDDAMLKEQQQEKLLALYQAARKVGRELMIEIIAGKHGALLDDTIARALDEIYALGIKPDWWKLEPQSSAAAWAKTEAVIKTRDPWCRGIVVLGLDAPVETLEQSFRACAGAELVRGFAVGRTIFAESARAWLSGEISDDHAIKDMARRFDTLCKVWLQCRTNTTG